VANEYPSFGDGSKTLDELNTIVVVELPTVCEVMDANLQDPRLKPFYKDLPNLKCVNSSRRYPEPGSIDFNLTILAFRRGIFESWSDARGRGMIMFSRWTQMIREMDFE
jgi:hypothetical protein